MKSFGVIVIIRSEGIHIKECFHPGGNLGKEDISELKDIPQPDPMLNKRKSNLVCVEYSF